jgi:dipeptidase E
VGLPSSFGRCGGNLYHLAGSIIANELADDMADMLGTKVYVGASAGSMIFSKQLTEQTAEALGDTGDLRKLGETRARSPFGFLDWYLKPSGFGTARSTSSPKGSGE